LRCRAALRERATEQHGFCQAFSWTNREAPAYRERRDFGMKTRVLIFSLLLLALVAAPLVAHHSLAPYYYTNRLVTVTGTIVKVDWVQPATFVHLKVDDKATGKTTLWAFEGESFVYQERFVGLQKEMLKEGSVVTILAFPGKPGADVSETVADKELAARVRAATQAAFVQFEFADGRKIPVIKNALALPRQ
jgi:hypothetical protein